MNAVIQAAADLQAVCDTGGLPFETSAVARSSVFTFPPRIGLRTCSAEDLLIFKAFADRPKDWVDIDGILLRQTGRLDWDYLIGQLSPLVERKEAPHILERLAARRAESEK